MHATRTDTYDNAYPFTHKLRATYDGVSAFLFTRTLRGLAAMCIICTSRTHSTRHALYDYVDAAIRQHPMIELVRDCQMSRLVDGLLRRRASAHERAATMSKRLTDERSMR